MSKILVVYNPQSGNADAMDEIKTAFARHHITPGYIAITDSQLPGKLRRARQTPGTTVVAAGGDGTINSIAGQLYGTPCMLGIIPAGTLNHFASALNIPTDIPKAVAIILRGKHRQVDVGTVNQQVFVNNSSIGLYPHSLRTRQAYGRHIGKWPAAFIGFVRAAIRPRHYHLQMVIDGKKQTLRTSFVFIGNNEYKRTQPDFGNRVSLDSGLLAVYIIKATHPLAIIRTVVHTLFTTKRRTKDFAMHLASECVIHTRHHRKIKVACDGEVLTVNTPLRYRSEPSSLQVIVPYLKVAQQKKKRHES